MIIDISPDLTSRTAVWPGDQPLCRDVSMQLTKGDSVTLSSLRSTVHLGAHADAPSHYHKSGISIEQVDLNAYLGPCRVVHCTGVQAITPDHCKAALDQKATRILFRTDTFPDTENWVENFAWFSPEAMEEMGQAGVLLVGIDTPSVDPFSSKELLAHQKLFQYGIRNLEGLDLSLVDEGEYELIALPLKLSGFDASPVRAVLRR